MSTSPNSAPPEIATVDGRGHNELGVLLAFWLGAVAVAAGLGIAAAHAPPRIRLLGLFSIGFGLLMGWFVTRLAAMLNLRIGFVHIAWIGLVTMGGLVASVLHTVALQPPPTPTTLPHPIAAMLAAKMQEESGLNPGDAMPELANAPAQAPGFGSRVQRYLTRRVQMLGDWPSPWPELFWGVELLAGTASAVGIALWSTRGAKS